MNYSTKVIELGSAAFRQPKAKSHCRFIHGYRLTTKITFRASELDENNWVMDFGGLKELKTFLQDKFDHKLVIADNDPELKTFKELEKKGVAELTILEGGVGIEKFAEFVCKAAHDFVQHKTDNRVECTQAEVFEHADNSAVYSRVVTPTMTFADQTTETPEVSKTPAKKKTKAVAKEETTGPKKDHIVPKETKAPPQGVPVGGKNRPSTWDFGTAWG